MFDPSKERSWPKFFGDMMIFQKIFILSAALGLQSSAQVCPGQNEDPCPVIEKSMPYSSSESPSLEYPPPQTLLQPETLLMLLTLEMPPGRSKWATLLISCLLLPLELVGGDPRGVVGHIIVGLDRWWLWWLPWWWCWWSTPLVEDPVAPTLEVLVLNGATELCLKMVRKVCENHADRLGLTLWIEILPY